SVFHGIRFKVRRLFVGMTDNFFVYIYRTKYMRHNHRICMDDYGALDMVVRVLAILSSQVDVGYS
ncbi:hypothetical protein, partial [uncultured Duncaniella sp.]